MPKRAARSDPRGNTPKKPRVPVSARSLKKQTSTKANCLKVSSKVLKHPAPANRRATRSMTLTKRTVFPFLELPGELRNSIYEFALGGFDGLTKFLDAYYISHTQGQIGDSETELRTPSLLLVSKQITREALYVLHRQKLTLPHGMLPDQHISSVISPSLLLNLRHVNFMRDVNPHDNSHCWCDIMEYFQMVKECINIWAGNMSDLPNNSGPTNRHGSSLIRGAHNLQSLTIDIRGREIARHLEECPPAGRCFFLEEIEDMLEKCRRLRGIKNVDFGGFLAPYTNDTKQLMESQPCYLLKLPRRLRDKIWGYCADLNDVDAEIAKHIGLDDPLEQKDCSTPSVLLVNKQISEETLAVLRTRMLTLTAPPRHSTLLSYIKPAILRTVRQLRIIIDLRKFTARESLNMVGHWSVYIDSIGCMLEDSHAIEKLHITLHKKIKSTDNTIDDCYIDRANEDVEETIGKFRNIAAKTVFKGIKKVMIDGDVPPCLQRELRNKLEKGTKARGPRRKSTRTIPAKKGQNGQRGRST